MRRLCLTGHTDIGNKELEECSTEQIGTARTSEEGQGPHARSFVLLVINTPILSIWCSVWTILIH